MLHEDIKNQLKEAMKKKEQTRLNVIRGMLTAFTNELVATQRTPQDMLPDEDALKVISRLTKQRKDSIEQFENGGRTDLADIEKAELVILEAYLPARMSRDDIRPVAEAKKAELGITDKGKIGILTGAVMKELKGAADGADVKAVVESLF